MTANESDSVNPANTPAPALEEGQKLAGCYLLRKRVNTGGDRRIWLAHDEVLGKDISLHFLPDSVRSDSRAMEEIRDGVKRGRQLIHPNIVRVHDLIEEPGWTAVSMDSLPNESLDVALKNRAPGEASAAQGKDWSKQLARTLEDAHKIHLTHGDLAPANLYLEPSGKLRVAAFGISRAIEDSLNRSGSTAALPGPYLSPQQLRGEKPAGSDDIYSFGVLAHQFLTGALPETSDAGVEAAGVSAQLSSVLKDDDATIAKWSDMIAGCVEKEPAKRFASARELAASLPGTVEEVAAVVPKVASVSEPAAQPVPVAEVAPAPVAAPEPPVKPVAALMAAAAAAKAAAQPAQDRAEKKPADSVTKQTAAPSPEEPRDTKPVKANSADTRGPAEGKPAGKPTKPTKRGEQPSIYPAFYPKRSGVSGLAVAAGVALAAVVIGGIYVKVRNQKHAAASATPEIAMTDQPYGTELRSVNNKIESPRPAPVEAPPAPTPAVAPAESTASAVEDIAPAPTPKPEVVPEALLLAANNRPRATPKPEKEPAPAPAAVSVAPAAAAPLSPLEAEALAKDPIVAAKAAALEKIKQAAQSAEAAHQDLLKQQQDAAAAAADLQKQITDATKQAAPLKKDLDEIAKLRKLKEDAQKAAEVEAQRAQQIAAEKLRAAEEAKKALAALEGQSKEKQTSQAKVDSDVQMLQKSLAEKQKAASDLAKTVADAGATRQQQAAALGKAEQDLEQARAAVRQTLTAEYARKTREEAERVKAEKAKEREKIEKEIVDMKKLFDEKLKGLEAAQKAISDADAKSKESDAMEKRAIQEANKIQAAPSTGASANPAKAPVAPSVPLTTVPDKAQTPDLIGDADKATLAATTLAMKTEPPKTIATTTPPQIEKTAPKTGAGFENSLGMRFVPVGDVLFCVWQTRVRDFEAFARVVTMKSSTWKSPGFKQSPDHPVVNVTWVEAVAFCKWLTEVERKSGLLQPTQFYRLPTDLEWSKAVGLPEESGKTPEARDMGVPDVYPWGNQWPPPPGAGNYTGEETGSDVAIKGYDDTFPWTSPVGSFPPNKLGLYDMGGNVWQWTMDTWNAESKHKVLRGASWYNGALKLSLLSSCRVHAAPDSSTDNYGFRIVRADDAVKSAKK